MKYLVILLLAALVGCVYVGYPHDGTEQCATQDVPMPAVKAYNSRNHPAWMYPRKELFDTYQCTPE